MASWIIEDFESAEPIKGLNTTCPYHLVESLPEIAHTVSNILELAWVQWQQAKKTAWQEVVPFYGQSPVNN